VQQYERDQQQSLDHAASFSSDRWNSGDIRSLPPAQPTGAVMSGDDEGGAEHPG
jgi:hypothetical protein